MERIEIGNYANDGTGDDLRTAFTKVNANFAALGTNGPVIDGANLGSGVAIFAQRNETDPNLEFKTLTSVDQSVHITQTATTVNLQNNSKLLNDPSPKLGANLDLDQYYIYHGDVQTTVFGLDLRTTNTVVELLIGSNSVDLSMGTFLEPNTTTFDLDMNGILLNGFAGTPSVVNLDFGSFVN
jgi:hypothetical protein